MGICAATIQIGASMYGAYRHHRAIYSTAKKYPGPACCALLWRQRTAPLMRCYVGSYGHIYYMRLSYQETGHAPWATPTHRPNTTLNLSKCALIPSAFKYFTSSFLQQSVSSSNAT